MNDNDLDEYNQCLEEIRTVSVRNEQLNEDTPVLESLIGKLQFQPLSASTKTLSTEIQEKIRKYYELMQHDVNDKWDEYIRNLIIEYGNIIKVRCIMKLNS